MIPVSGQLWRIADTQLAELNLLFDREAIARAFNNQPATLRADYIRYKPGTSALVRMVEQTSTGAARVLGYAKTFAKQDVAKLEASNQKCSLPGATVPIAIGDHSLVFPFPSDHRLRALWRTSTVEGRARLAKRLDLVVDSVEQLNVLAYKPEKRCVIRASDSDGSEVVVKFLGAGHWTQARANARMARKIASVPALRRASRRYGALVYDYLPGQGMREHLDVGIDVAALRECGAAVAHLQSKQNRKVPQLTRQRELDALDSTARLLAALLHLESPEDEQRVIAVHAHLREWLKNQSGRRVLCHGDFYDKQLLLTSGEIALLDFDDACIADARLDVANFVAHRLRHGDQQGERLLSSMIDGFPRLQRPALQQIHGYVAVRLFLLCHHPFRALQDDWLEETRRLLGLCWHWYEESRHDNWI